ncbi:hypothetical protein Tsubulata_045479 [Turnera subulata]|uniref:TIR domain-containing protein n=1 Tax=Turnera subulata TaxID=218843 RepID=A0A9Q0GA76_9ROSI|nr:hypothetical protein Tsubulata_045479 [Turnera subulata]
MAASSSNDHPPVKRRKTSNDDDLMKKKYDVFLNFRGRDTRFGFTTNLKEALCDKLGIEVFLDEEGLRGGDDISPVLLQRIQESSISVVIFSKNYADSPWCLDELVQIHDQCMQSPNHVVLPIFYGVDPTHVQELQGDFGKAFMGLLLPKANSDHKNMKNKAKRWKEALSHISNLKGWDSHKFRSQSELIKEIVKDIESKLKHSSMPSLYDDYSSSGLVGMESRVEEVLSLLDSGGSSGSSSRSIRIVGIWGMGGIGKTTLSEIVFKAISSQFDGACFLRNVKEMSQNPTTTLADELLSQLLEIPNLKVGTPKLLPYGFSRRLERRKVLIVVDDVSSSLQLEQLIGDHSEIFGSGSRVIVTSRDRQVLECRCDAIYEVMKLNNADSHQLFKLHAFKENSVIHMDPSFTTLSWEMVRYARGNPLALKVLGCGMFKKDKESWESALRKLKDSPHKDIQDVLKLSYDGLDWKEQQILLDIACVFEGWCVHDIEAILDARHAIEGLMDKCLVTLCRKEDWDERTEMHDLIKQMCKDIVLEENRWDPRKRSRLWRYNDILQVLNQPKGAKRVEALSLDMTQINHMQLSPKAFEELYNLRLLHFYFGGVGYNNHVKLHLPQQGLEYLPNTLRLLHWDLYPAPSLPSNFRPESLVHLEMPESSLTQLWEGENVHLVSLKVCDLRWSKQLIKIMDFSGVPNLEELDLWGCWSLVGIPSSIQLCRKLIKIDVSQCDSLCGFPSDLRLTSLEEVSLYGCPRITELPMLPSTVKSLNSFKSGIKQVAGASIGHLTRLQELRVGEILEEGMPCEIGFLTCLEELSFGGGPTVTSIPRTIHNLTRLKTLHCCFFENLESLPDGIGRLESLGMLFLEGCSKMTSLPSDIGGLTSLTFLTLSGCSSITSLPESLGDLKSLHTLNLGGCVHLKCFPDHDRLPLPVSLVSLDLSGTSIEYLGGEVMKRLSKLKWLHVRDCKRLGGIQLLPAGLSSLDAANCTSLASVSSSSLQYCDLNFVNCFMLDTTDFIESVLYSRALSPLNHHHRGEMKFWMPGDEIPQWFEYKLRSSIQFHSIGSSSSVVVPMLHPHGGRRLIVKSLTIAYVVAPPIPDQIIYYPRQCYALGESGVCFHIANTEAFNAKGVLEAHHVFYSCDWNLDALDRSVWAEFVTPIIPGVQVIQFGVHLSFADGDDFEKLEDQRGGGGGETNQYIMAQDKFEAIVSFMKQNKIKKLDTNNFKALEHWDP